MNSMIQGSTINKTMQNMSSGKAANQAQKANCETNNSNQDEVIHTVIPMVDKIEITSTNIVPLAQGAPYHLVGSTKHIS